MRVASRILLACACAITAWLVGGCSAQRGARAPPAHAIFHAALVMLASATEPEAPRAILAWLPRGRDAACGAARDARARVWCHLRRARVRVAGGDARGRWWVVVEVPTLSDHVHVVDVRRRRGALEAVRVDSAN